MAKSVALMAFSPLDVFSLAMGAGLVGTLLLTVLGPTQLLIAAICGALLFNFGVTKPLMRFFFAFAAPPSQGLEGMVSQPAEAETAFDHEGQGLIKLTLDGQTVQLLGKLDAGEQAAGVHVAKGDSVIILEVDAKKNICRVTRDLTL